MIELIDQFLARKGSILVFVKTKRSADKMVKRLKKKDIRQMQFMETFDKVKEIGLLILLEKD
jgi:superfamily II DNA/RNA helicase